MLPAVESLESRQLLDGEPWSLSAGLIGQVELRRDFPTITGQGQTIAILDTGVDFTHPFLGAGFGDGFKIVGGYDFFEDDPNPTDIDGHGTAVAGIIAAEAFEFGGRTYAGLAPGANIVAVRISDSTTDPVPDSRMNLALQWVIDHREEFGITVVNISFGFGSILNRTDTGPYAAKLTTLRDAGVIVVASSGNEGITEGQGIQYPAADRNVLAVGAVDEFDTITPFSQRDATLDLLAVGDGVASTTLNGMFTGVSGTSFASPAVAAAAALIRQAAPALPLKDVISILRASGRDNVDGDAEAGTTSGFHFSRLQIDSAVAIAQDRAAVVGDESLIGKFGNANGVQTDKYGILHFAWYDSADRVMKYAARSSGGVWSTPQIVDAGGDDVGQYLSLALDSNGKPAIAYFNATHGDLQFAQLNGGDWSHETLDAPQSTGLYASLAFDRDNAPTIAYFHRTKGDLRWARIRNGAWEIRDLDTNEISGRSVSLALQPNGFFAAAYENSTTGRLKYAYQFAGSSWLTDTVDRTKGVAFISLLFDNDGRPNISYYDATPANLKYAVFKNNRWTSGVVSEKGAVGLYSQAIIGANGQANILFYNRRLDKLQRAAGELGGWSISNLQSEGGRYLSSKPIGGEHLACYAWFDTTEQKIKVAEL